MDEQPPLLPPLISSRSRWVSDGTPPAGQRAALHRLAAALRRTIDELMDMDAPEADLLEAAEGAERFAARLEERRSGHAHYGFAETSPSGDARAMFDRSPLIGLANPIAPPLTMAIVGEHVEATATFGAAYEGPPGHVHGGIIAAAFDEVLGMVQSLTGRPGMTGTLTVKYRRPTPLYRELHFRAHVQRVEGRKIFAHGTLHAGEMFCAEAEGVFVSVDFEKLGIPMPRADPPHH
jgi:acyl-coenzyme A thioesterase PaaI-like protein